MSEDASDELVLYRTLFERASTAVAVVRRDGDGQFRYVDVNETAGALLGLDPESAIDRRPAQVLPDETADRIVNFYEDALESGEKLDSRHITETERGERLTRSRYHPVETDDGSEFILVMVEDITELAQTQRELDAERRALRRLYKLTARPETRLDEKVETMLEIGTDRLDVPYGFVSDISEGQQTIRAAVGSHPSLQPGERAPISESYCRLAVDSDDLVVICDAPEEGFDSDPAYGRFELDCYVGAKLVVEGEIEGTICFAASESRDEPFDELERTFVKVLAEWTAREYERARHLERLESRARTDELTGLANKGELIRRLGSELDRAERHGHALAFLLADLDHFKSVNDELGHLAGDSVLQSVGALLREQTRSSDVPFRYGGEEFAIIAPHSDLAKGRKLAGRLKASIRGREYDALDDGTTLTCSIGVTAHDGDSDRVDDVIERADRALYRAKNGGRDKIEVAEPPVTPDH